MRLSDWAFTGWIADADVSIAAALVIILRRFTIRFPTLMRQNANLCGLTTLVKLTLAYSDPGA
jgi:hypothetical protein